MTEIEKQHAFDLKNVQEQVKFFYSQKKKVKIYHGSTNSTRAQKFKKGTFVDISQLNRVLKINTDKKYILVEPNVPMDKLVEETLRHSLIPPAVPEFPGITVGGGVQGGVEESSSFKYGLLHDCCLEYEIVLGNGYKLTASPQKNSDLFWGIAGSYGSLGIITLAKLQLVPAKNFIHLTYHTVNSFEEAVDLMRQKSSEKVDFIDGIMFAKNFGVVTIGNFSDKQTLPISTFHKASDEWFYLHAKTISQNHNLYKELIPIIDYLFRYDRGAFWMGRFGFKILKIPFTRFTRFILNGICNTRTLYRLVHETNLSQRYFIQDFNLPQETVLKFLQLVDKELTIYPLWICPLKPGKEDKLSANCITTDLVFNIGIWGEVHKDFSGFVTFNRDFEQKTFELGGRKMLYAQSYYPQDEFWKIYDFAWYSKLREKYFANLAFPDIYDKTKVVEKYKPSILVGIWKALRSPKLPIS